MSPNYKTIHNTMKGFTAWFNLFHGSFCWCAVKRFLIWDHSDSLTPLLDDSSPNPMPIYLGCDSYHLVREQLKTHIICAMGQRHSSTPLSKNTWYLFQFERRHTKKSISGYHMQLNIHQSWDLCWPNPSPTCRELSNFYVLTLIELLFANSHPIFL